MPEALQRLRLSPQQLRLWALAQADRGWPLLAAALFEIEGDLESRALKAAVEAVVSQHEILRTDIFPGPAAVPCQSVAERAAYELRIFDQELGAETAEEQIVREAMFWDGGARLAVWHIRPGDGASFLMLRLPALSSDRQGLYNIARALLCAYAACREGREPRDEPLQYADVAEVFCQLLESDETRDGREYWRGRWPADAHILRLPVARSAPLLASGSCLEAVRRFLPGELAARLADLAGSQGVTVEAVVASCWLGILGSASGLSDLTLGVILPGRDFEELAGAVGPFARCLPLRAVVRGEARFGDYVERIERDLAEMRRFQDYFSGEPESFLPFGFEFSSSPEIAESDLKLSVRWEQVTADRFHLFLSLRWDWEAPQLTLISDARIYGRDEVAKLAEDLMLALDHCAPSIRLGSLCPRAPVGPEAVLSRTEELVAGIWTEMLGTGTLGAQDDFFALGGDSSLATCTLSRVRAAFGVELPVRILFETPTIRGLSERIDRERRRGEAVALASIGRADRGTSLPLSFAQQRMWFLHQLHPNSPVYNISNARLLVGELDLVAFAGSLSAVVGRHEALRTVFEEAEGEPSQVIRPAAPISLPLVDLSGLEAGRARAEMSRVAAEESVRPFDLARGPLLRVAVVRLRGEEHAIITTMHHIVSDGWSMGVFQSEIMALYAAARSGGSAPLPALEVQYADFAAWQRRWLSGPVLETELAFWRQRLAGAPPVLELPADRPRPAVPTGRGASRSFAVGAVVSEKLRRLSRQQGSTLFITLLAAFQVLLHRLTGEMDVMVGTPVAGRNRLEIEGLIGCFVNTLALRCDVSGSPSFRDLLGRTREVVLEAHAHQDVPFEKLVEELSPERSLSHAPLFQVMLLVRERETEDRRLPRVRVSGVETATVVTKFDLTVALAERGSGLGGAMEHSVELFDGATIQRWCGHLVRLLSDMVTDPERRISEASLLSPTERWQLVVEWNETGEDAGPESSLQEMFARQAEATPEATALERGEARWSYGHLDTRSNQIAHVLRGLGVGPEVLVGTYLDRHEEMVAGLLGVLKAGGAYVPLDSRYSTEMLELMVRDAGIRLVLTREHLRGKLAFDGLLVLSLDGDLADLDAMPRTAPAVAVASENLVYVIFTSGSSGPPKGVMVTHGALVSYLRWCFRAYGVGAGSSAPVDSPLSFDLTVTSLLAPLVAGGRVALLAEQLGVEALADALKDGDWSVVKITPAHLEALSLKLTDWESAVRVQCLVVGGEELHGETLVAWARHSPMTRVINEYGPTEAVVGCSTLELRAGEAVGGELSIGRPITNVRLYVLDPNLGTVPIGVAGELCVGGVGLARGYLGCPALTAARFVPDPFAGPQGGGGKRLYRTGDLTRHRSDGRLEFLGRIDHQVKVRGFRIELSAIESVLLDHPLVREAVVVVREDAPGDRRLVAYVVMDGKAESDSDLRAFLRGKLPEYMVPSAIERLPSLPLTPNGKLDRAALPAPEWRSTENSYLTPRTLVEEVLAGIWAEVLGLERVGAADHFFELGGHSLLATRVMSRLRSAFGVELPLRDLFEEPTVAGLAGRVESVLRTGAGLAVPPLVPVPREGALALSFAQQRLWFLDQLEPESPLYNMPVALRVEGPLDVAVLARSLTEIVRRHETLRTVFASVDGEPVQVVQPAGSFAQPVVDLSALPELEREALAFAMVGSEASRPFHLARGPLFRSTLLRLGAEDHAALVTMHHIVSDGWSMGLLVREVTALYAAFAAGRPSSLPALPLQYADFAVWQRSWLQGEVLEGEISFWRRQLAGLPPLLELPTDRPRPAAQSYRGATRPARLPAGLARQLEALARREGATLFMALLAGFQTLLARYSGQDDLAVGSPIAGRNRAEIEGLIGFFVNTLVLRGDLSGDLPGGRAGGPALRELLGRVRETALAAYMHQDVPFEKLVEELAPERSLAHSPLFQVMLVLQNAPAESLEIRDLRLRSVGGAWTTAKFDLTLSLVENDGELVGTVEHATDLYDGATVDRLIGHFERLLAAAVSTPDEPVLTLPLLSPEESGQILIEWNDTAAVPSPRAWVYELFELQMRRTPEAVAVVLGDEALTYAELGARAGRLAGRLRQLGLGPDRLAGLLVERSLEMIVGVLGILQAGGAYVPLDPAYPAQRLAFMLDDTRVSVLLTQTHLRDRAPAGSTEILLLDGDAGPLAAGDVVPAGGEPAAENLAYVIYTSGSTGRPKGVALSHRALRNLIDWHLATLLGSVRTLQFASLSFDASFHEMFACWASGGTLVVVPEELRRDMAALAGLLVEQGIEKAILPVVVLQHLAEILSGQEPLPPLREITTTGERLQTNRAMAALLQRLPGCAFHNHYGPSETHVATASTLCPDPEGWPLYPPIGRPIGNSSAYVVQPGLVPAPIGLPGDLYLGGACLARGYLERPDLTAQRFVPDPFGGEPGARLYRTGDKVRLLASGDLEYLGRFDDQVKIRGFRIELGEIEAALLALPGVREAAVLAREDVPGNKRLVAYVVGEVPADELERRLRDRLPEYMVPAMFMVLDALPLSPNGKVDRKALSAPVVAGENAGSSLKTHAVKPRDILELRLIRLWGEILGMRVMSVRDDFFALGGHSLLAVRLLARIRREFGRDLPVSMMFEARTVESLARRLRDEPDAAVDSLVVPIWSNGSRQPFFCVHPIGGNVLCYLELSQALGRDQPFYGVQSPRTGGALPPRIEDLASRYVQAIREVQPEGPYALGGWSMGGLVAFEMACRLTARGEQVSLLALIDSSGEWGRAAADDATLVRMFAQDTADLAGLDLHRLAGTGPEPDEEAVLSWVLTEGRSRGVIPLDLSLDDARDMFLIFKRNHEALAKYVAGPYRGRLELFRAQSAWPTIDPAAGWRELAAEVGVHLLPGDHYSLLKAPQVELLAERLRALIDASMNHSRTGGKS